MSDRPTPETDAFAANMSEAFIDPAWCEFSQQLERERDEAREALMKIEEVFIDGDDTYADREKMGSIAVSALAARGLIRSLPQAALDENKMSDMNIKLAQQETITGEGLE